MRPLKLFLICVSLGLSSVGVAEPGLQEMSVAELIANRSWHEARAEYHERNANRLAPQLFGGVFYGYYSGALALNQYNWQSRIRGEIEWHWQRAAQERQWARSYNTEISRRALESNR